MPVVRDGWYRLVINWQQDASVIYDMNNACAMSSPIIGAEWRREARIRKWQQRRTNSTALIYYMGCDLVLAVAASLSHPLINWQHWPVQINSFCQWLNTRNTALLCAHRQSVIQYTLRVGPTSSVIDCSIIILDVQLIGGLAEGGRVNKPLFTFEKCLWITDCTTEHEYS